MGKYDDIMHLDRPVDTIHKPMPLHKRAAQFAPFDALTGFSGVLHETSRITEAKVEITDEVKTRIDEQLRLIEKYLKNRDHAESIGNSSNNAAPLVTIRHFVQDKTKDGGAYQTTTAHILKIDQVNATVKLENNCHIAFTDIVEIETEIETDH